MELKLPKEVKLLGLSLKYQSYLYGIEIVQHVLQIVYASVSIVPLWNWNTAIRLLSCRGQLAYQSYLYGIEIAVAPAHETGTALYQSYLYGIEIFYSFNHLLKFILVSIVPLWNWNFSNVIALLGMISINRTFMELKSKEIYEKEGISPQYQSYLYGIEIPPYVFCRVEASLRINRTFMELK